MATAPVTFPKQEPVYPVGFEPPEPPKDKLFRKLKEQPLVPLGSLATCGALVVASYQLRKGNRATFNRALRWRIYFQGLTVVAAIAGIWLYDPGRAAKAPPSVKLGDSAGAAGAGAGTAGDSSSSGSSSSDDDEATSASASAAYANVTTTPGRPPTNFQVANEESRQEKAKREWQQRFQAAQDRVAAADSGEEQRRLEAALLKGTGLNLDELDQASGAGSAASASSGAQEAEGSAVPRTRPVIGQDRRDRRTA
ncbi:unnamed protein product [Jaminaea pallidilutea]